jgi:hypothetical protein
MSLDSSGTMSQPAFKTCGSCQYTWIDWWSFVFDPAVRLIGLQAIPGIPDANVLVFEHRCGGSVSVLTHKLRHLLGTDEETGERSLLFGTENCSGHCRVLEDLSSCDKPCVNARERRLATLISDTKKGLPTGLSDQAPTA